MFLKIKKQKYFYVEEFQYFKNTKCFMVINYLFYFLFVIVKKSKCTIVQKVPPKKVKSAFKKKNPENNLKSEKVYKQGKFCVFVHLSFVTISSSQAKNPKKPSKAQSQKNNKSDLFYYF